MRRRRPRDIAKIFAEGVEIDAALKRAVREALLTHKRAGNPIAQWRNGRVVWIPPEDIVVDEPEPRNTRIPSRQKGRKRSG